MQGDLDRYLEAQEKKNDGYDDALTQLRHGRKAGHWMWYVFPQIEGLGRTDTARYYAIVSLDEARAYFAHPILGARLLECARALLATKDRTVEDIFDHPDEMKLRSCMTLFLRAAPDEPLFGQVLERFFDGPDDETGRLLHDQLLPVRNRRDPL
jgi:uncharacterized protein (DUF1810 family)